MATRGYIVKINDGFETNGVFLFQDSYPSYAGQVLVEHYGNEDKLDKLISNGAIYSLRKDVNETKYIDNEECIFHNINFQCEDLKQTIDNIISCVEAHLVIEWLYVFYQGKWSIYHIRDLFGRRNTTKYDNLDDAIDNEI